MRKLIYVDMDGVLCDFKGAVTRCFQENPAINYPQSQYGFFTGLAPIKNGVETVKKLAEYFDVYILTAPSVKNPLCYTEKRVWIEKHFGMAMVKKLIISPNKGLNKGDYLIDDFISGNGQENFEGKVLHFGFDYKDWDVIWDYFDSTYL